MGEEPMGAKRSHPYRLVLDMGCSHLRVSVPHRARHLSAIFRQSQAVCEQRFAIDRGADPGARTQTFADRATVSLDYGGLDVHALVYRFPTEGGNSVRLGHLSLDRG